MQHSSQPAQPPHRPRAEHALLAPLVGLVLAALFVGCSFGRAPIEEARSASPESGIEVHPVIASEPPALTEGWTGFLQGLERARRNLEDPSAYPPEPTDRNLAEGYRYLLGHLARIIEAETEGHPDFPYFRRSVSMMAKWTIENPDTMYLSATIDAAGTYRIRGQALDTTGWRTSEPGVGYPRAPRVVIFQTTTAVVGQTGRLEEMAECRNQTLDALDQFLLEIDDDGRFEILVAAERPEGYAGNFLATRAELPCRNAGGGITIQAREATQLNVREIFSDWDAEMPLDLEIVRLDKRGESRPPRTPEEMGRHLDEIGRRLANQIVFWNLLHEFGLEVRGDRDDDGRTAFPMNALNPPAPPFIAGGTAGAGQLYAAGSFELAEDEALVVRVAAPAEPHYIGFQLGNLWGEGPDQANYVSSLTGTQNPVASDGARWYVVSARDPGTAGWVDTTGLPKGTIGMRFIYRDPPAAGDMPTIETFRVRTDEVRTVLPTDTPSVTPDARRQQVHARQLHIQRRWRQY
ncbi:MAG: hypothetical protein H6748_12470 [Spirochaetaceae bacterium]|nr:hypothetical protein [Myxococcales bacterium]MCB9724855.1 hypothetical protein [Spirochaetaceae bacterium]